MNRRHLLLGAGALIAAPAIIIPKFAFGQYVLPVSLTVAAVNAAIASLAPGGGTVWLPPGVLDPSAGQIIGASNVTLRGTRGATIIRVPWHVALNYYLINGQGCDNFHVADITFDMGDIDPPDDNWPTSASGAVLVGANAGVGGHNCSIRNCEVINAGRYVFVARGGTRNLRIIGNDITRSAAAGTPNIGIMLRKDGGVANFFAEISGNNTSGTCGFDGAIYQGKITRNVMRSSGFGGNLVLDQDANCTKNIVSHNICSDLVSLLPGLGGDGMEIWSTDSLIADNVTDNNAGWGLTIAARDCSVIGHRSANNRSHGIYLDGAVGAAAHNTFLDGCKTRGNGGSPYFVDAGIVGTILGSNDFR